jgi:hypothetical protein
MSDKHRTYLMGEYRSRVRAVMRGATEADMDAFDALVVRDCVVTDDGAPHPKLVAWVQRIIDRNMGGAVAVPVVPTPKTGPVGAEVTV